MKVKYICSECGSENVLIDAWAAWNYEMQEFELDNVFDACICGDCEAQFNHSYKCRQEVQ